MKQYKFRVPPEMYPGILRAGLGVFEVGDIIMLPDSKTVEGDKVDSRMIPMDQEARDYLAEQHKPTAGRKPKGYKEPVIKDVEGAPPPEEEVADETMTVKETAEKFSGTSIRASDK